VAGGLTAAAPVQTRVIKTGSIDIEVSRGRFGQTVTSLTGLVVGLGGYVSDSKTFESDKNPSGTLTLRVPANSYESLLAQAKTKGKVRSSSSTGQDVTGQYTDVQARLTALTAARDQLLTVLRQATSIPDILAVQDRITNVQGQIEQLQGQLKVLDDETSFATLAVNVAEPGAKVAEPASSNRRGIKKAWHQAVDGFIGGAEAVVAHSGAVLLVLLVLGLIAAASSAVWRVARRRIV
jgi:hypothetical protein